jgi:hypothetical protein
MTATPTEIRFPTPEAGRICEGVYSECRSYDHRGIVFSWVLPPGLNLARAAVDVEAMDCPVDAFGARFGLTADIFLARWTALEALAKALDQPILSLLKQYGLSCAATPHWTRFEGTAVWLRGIEHPTHWVTVAAVI